MTTLGWSCMSVSLLAVWGGAFWCYRKVLQTPHEEKAPVGFGP